MFQREYWRNVCSEVNILICQTFEGVQLDSGKPCWVFFIVSLHEGLTDDETTRQSPPSMNSHKHRRSVSTCFHPCWFIYLYFEGLAPRTVISDSNVLITFCMIKQTPQTSCEASWHFLQLDVVCFLCVSGTCTLSGRESGNAGKKDISSWFR